MAPDDLPSVLGFRRSVDRAWFRRHHHGPCAVEWLPRRQRSGIIASQMTLTMNRRVVGHRGVIVANVDVGAARCLLGGYRIASEISFLYPLAVWLFMDERQARLLEKLVTMGANPHPMLSSAAEKIGRGYSPLQSFFFAMSSRRDDARVVDVDMGKDSMQRAARRIGGIVKQGYVIDGIAYVLPK